MPPTGVLPSGEVVLPSGEVVLPSGEVGVVVILPAVVEATDRNSSQADNSQAASISEFE